MVPSQLHLKAALYVRTTQSENLFEICSPSTYAVGRIRSPGDRRASPAYSGRLPRPAQWESLAAARGSVPLRRSAQMAIPSGRGLRMRAFAGEAVPRSVEGSAA